MILPQSPLNTAPGPMYTFFPIITFPVTLAWGWIKVDSSITGLYLFDNRVVSLSKKLKPSKRNELEITDLLKIYLKKGQLKHEILGRGFTWFDAGTHDSLLLASQFIKAIEDRQGYKIGCIEEIAYANKWIDRLKLKKNLFKYKNSSYGKYLNKILEQNW